MTISRPQAILLGVALAIVAVVAFIGGRGCTPTIVIDEPIVTGIDAGPGETEIGDRLDAALVAGAMHIEEIETKFEDDLAAFDAAQRAEYDRLRDSDLEATAIYLSRWSRSRRDAGPPPRPPTPTGSR